MHSRVLHGPPKNYCSSSVDVERVVCGCCWLVLFVVVVVVVVVCCLVFLMHSRVLDSLPKNYCSFSVGVLRIVCCYRFIACYVLLRLAAFLKSSRAAVDPSCGFPGPSANTQKRISKGLEDELKPPHACKNSDSMQYILKKSRFSIFHFQDTRTQRFESVSECYENRFSTPGSVLQVL